MHKNHNYLGNFENADFVRYLHFSNYSRADYISKLDPICAYVDANTITDDLLKMLKIFRDEYVYSYSWKTRIGATDAHIKLSDVKIELSEDIEKRSYQGIEFNREILEKITSQLRESREQPNNEIDNAGFEYSVFGSKTDIVLGKYNHLDKTITLYIRAILNSIIGKYSNVDKYTNFTHRFLAVFVHELFHAYHACDYDSNGHSWNNDIQKNEIIVESLAAHFEWNFIWDELGRHDMSDSMKNEWGKHACIVWPYAGAKYIQYFIVKNKKIEGEIIKCLHHNRFRRYHLDEDNYYRLKSIYERYRENAHISGGNRRMLFYKLSLSGLSFAQTMLMDYEINELVFPIRKLHLRR